MKIAKVNQHFARRFGRSPERSYFSPGRVNLIGEHIDYNGGQVMPVAIGLGTYFAVSPNGTDQINIYSTLFDEQKSVNLSELTRLTAAGNWVDYIVGMLQCLTARSGRLSGLDILVSSDMPQNSGLSSSASFSVGFGFALIDLLGLEINRLELALMAQSAENDFVGVNCGIMDQFAVAMGQSDHCIVLDCESLESELLPMSMNDHEIVIANSMVPRKLSESNYNLRRTECEEALRILQLEFPVQQLCELKPEQVESSVELKKHAIPFRRARHASSEHQRVHESVIALKQGRLADFGKLMNASHDSLRDDFEVSCEELNLLVSTAVSIQGVLGSRMTGAGFGGCTVSIVESTKVSEFSSRLSKTYSDKTPFEAEIYIAKPCDGVKRVS